MGVSLPPPTITTVLVRTCRRDQDGWKERNAATYVENLAKKAIDLEDPRPLLNQAFVAVTQKFSQRVLAALVHVVVSPVLAKTQGVRGHPRHKIAFDFFLI